MLAGQSCYGGSLQPNTDAALEGASGEAHGSVEDVSIQLEVDKTRVLQKEVDLQSSSQHLAAQQAKRERAEAEDKLKSISQADKASRATAEAVQASINEQERLLRARQAERETARAQLDKDKTALLTRAVKSAALGPGAESTTQNVRTREDAVTKREVFLATREQELAPREVSAAHALTELRTLMETVRADISALKATPAPLAQPIYAQKTPVVTKAQVLRTMHTIRQKMSLKDMLTEDLPQAMQTFAQLAQAPPPGPKQRKRKRCVSG